MIIQRQDSLKSPWVIVVKTYRSIRRIGFSNFNDALIYRNKVKNDNR